MSEHRLGEIVIERPRHGRRISLKKVTGFKKDLNKITKEASEDGLFNPYIIKARGKTKYLSDHLGPLRRFLRSHVGEPWNEVYSELCQQLDPTTIVGKHVIDHLWDYVERHVEIIDGIPRRKPYWFHQRQLDESYRDQFYVHPETGILCAAKKVPRKQKQSHQTDVVMIDDYHQYRKLNEIWYLITFENFPPIQYVHDMLLGKIDRYQAPYIQGTRIYAARKKQCNKKQIRFILNQLARK
jgi:hypothetical protein